MDVIAKTQCITYSISIETLKNMVGDNYRDILYLNFIKMSFANSKNFKNINMKLLEKTYDSFKMKSFTKDEVVLPVGYGIISKIAIVIEGSIINCKNSTVIARRGDIIFEDDIFNGKDERLKNEFIAEPDCLLLEANTEVFFKNIGGSFKEIIRKSKILESVNKIPLFKNFTQIKKEYLSTIFKLETYENGKKIIVQGEEGNKFYIVKSGKVDIFANSSYIRTLNEFEYFGERALFFNERRTATAQANGKVELYVIDSIDFKNILEDNLAQYLKSRFYLQDNTIELKDLDYIKELGNGSYGSVSLVRSRKNKHLYAIKLIPKIQIDAEKLHENLNMEKSILLKIDHPFIVKLVKTLKDSKNIYFLMEYIRGKDLFDAIRDIGILTKYQTQFYSASMMLALEYLHERKFIYRDLKPENIIVQENV
jgi:cGMP-dependent protein kinase